MVKKNDHHDNIYMCRKSPAVAYITRLIKTTGRADLMAILDNSPLKTKDKELLLDYADGASYEELAQKNNITTAAIYARKRQIYEQLHFYLVQKLTNENE